MGWFNSAILWLLVTLPTNLFGDAGPFVAMVVSALLVGLFYMAVIAAIIILPIWGLIRLFAR